MKQEIYLLIKKMATANITWGAPRIYSGILMLGYSRQDISQRTVSRYLKRITYNTPNERKRRQQWKIFLKNHRKHLMAMDFFTVPTIEFEILYVFFIIDHARREIVHFNVTMHPTSAWVKQQLRESFPYETKAKYLIFDRDSIFSSEIKNFLNSVLGITPKIISYKAPWQNGTAERWVLSARTDMLNNIIILNEAHLMDMMQSYVDYYNNDRCHLSLCRNTPNGRKP